jgi:hypothetical protein
MRIKTFHYEPPIPMRCMYWGAIDDETYDGEGSPIGYGFTEQEAIEDLLWQIEENA